MMKNNNAPLGWTTVEQGQELLKCGIDRNTADLYYGRVGSELYPSPIAKDDTRQMTKQDFPCWSLGKLISFLPDEIETDGKTARREIFYDSVAYQYAKWKGSALKEQWQTTFVADSLMENVVRCLCWIINDKYIDVEQINKNR